MLNERQIEILQILLKNKRGCTSKYFSESLLVSSRTIRKDILIINEHLRYNGCQVKASKQKGYYIDNEHINLVEKFITSSYYNKNYNIPSNSNEREHYILGKVLLKNNLNIQDLSDSIFVSVQTIYKDVARLNERLVRHYNFNHLKLKKNNIYIDADEKDIRDLFFKLVSRELEIENKLKPDNLLYLMDEQLNLEELETLKNFISSHYERNNFVLSDYSLFFITWIIYFSNIRCKNGNFIKDIQPSKNKTNEVVSSLMESISKTPYIYLKEEDIYMIINYLDLVRLLNVNKSIHIVSEESQIILREFILEIINKYGINLYENLELVENLNIHLDLMLKRVWNNYKSFNPLLKDIKKKYALSYEIATLISPIIYKYTQCFLSEEEIAFIAVYIETFNQSSIQRKKAILVCGSGLGMVHLLKNWIERNFSNQIEVVAYLPLYQVDKYLEDNPIDLIISTIPIETMEDVRIIQVSHIPNNNDLDSIKKKLEELKINLNISDVIDRVFSEKLIEIYDDYVDFETVIKDFSRLLYENERIEDAEEFAKDIIQREKVYPTDISKWCLTPHPISTFATKTTFSIALLRKPIEINKKEIHIIILMALQPKFDLTLDPIFEIINIIGKDLTLIEMLKTLEKKEIIKKIKDIKV